MKDLISLFFCVLSLSSNSLEIDQFTDREKYQNTTPDFTPILNKYTNTLLLQIAKNFNHKYRDRNLATDEIHSHLAFEIYKATAGNPLQPYGFHIPDKINMLYAIYKRTLGPVQKWIASKENKNYCIHIKNNIYDQIYPKGFKSDCIIKIKNEFVGSDKIDHFFDQGYSYWIKSDHGQNDQRAKEFGRDGENDWFGLTAGGVFSYADLRANWEGYQFYKNLFTGPRPHFSITPNGKVKFITKFDWSNHIDWQFDELKNPPDYRPRTAKKVRDHLREDIKNYCHTYDAMKKQRIYEWISKREDFYLAKIASPQNINIFNLEEICSSPALPSHFLRKFDEVFLFLKRLLL